LRGSLLDEAGQIELAKQADKARLSIAAIAAPTLSPHPANAITAAQTESTMFAIKAMLGRPAVQLKMPRLDAYDVVVVVHAQPTTRL
jgi:hypothetical protein